MTERKRVHGRFTAEFVIEDVKPPDPVKPDDGEILAPYEIRRPGRVRCARVFPRGRVPAGSGVVFADVPTQNKVLWTWPDGSAKHVRITAYFETTGTVQLVTGEPASGSLTATAPSVTADGSVGGRDHGHGHGHERRGSARGRAVVYRAARTAAVCECTRGAGAGVRAGLSRKLCGRDTPGPAGPGQFPNACGRGGHCRQSRGHDCRGVRLEGGGHGDTWAGDGRVDGRAGLHIYGTAWAGRWGPCPRH